MDASVYEFTGLLLKNMSENDNPYKPLTREEIIEQLAIARQHADVGKTMDAHKASSNIREKYGL